MQPVRWRGNLSSRWWSIALCCVAASCLSPFESVHDSQWNSRDQIWLSEESQVKLRAAQSRVFSTTDRLRILRAVLATMQDKGLMVDVLDEELGVVSGSSFLPTAGERAYDPTYHLYDDDSLLVFTRNYRTWGPFHNRIDRIRLTVTVRQRNETQSVVRASAQFHLNAVGDPEVYQRFFRALEQSMFLEASLLAAGDGDRP